MIVIDKQTGKRLNDHEILAEINRDRSEEWTDYTIQDIATMPEDVIDWIDTKYYEVIL